MQFSLTSLDGITPALARALRAISPTQKAQLTNALAESLVTIAKQNFDTPALRPAPWPPRKTTRPGQGAALLVYKGLLKNSLRVTSSAANGSGLGSSRKYWLYHQFGAPRANIPARPFWPFTGPYGGPLALTPAARDRCLTKLKTALTRLLPR